LKVCGRQYRVALAAWFLATAVGCRAMPASTSSCRCTGASPATRGGRRVWPALTIGARMGFRPSWRYWTPWPSAARLARTGLRWIMTGRQL